MSSWVWQDGDDDHHHHHDNDGAAGADDNDKNEEEDADNSHAPPLIRLPRVTAEQNIVQGADRAWGYRHC
jgi:hypothetical protein